MAYIDNIARGLAIQGKNKAEEVEEKVNALSKGMTLRGEVDYYDLLPADPEVGDVYSVKYKGTSTEGGTELSGQEYVWGDHNGTNTWILLGPDMAQFVTLNQLAAVAETIPTRTSELINDERYVKMADPEAGDVLETTETNTAALTQMETADITMTSKAEVIQTRSVEASMLKSIEVIEPTPIETQQVKSLGMEMTDTVELEQAEVVKAEEASYMDMEQASVMPMEEASVVESEEAELLESEQGEMLETEEANLVITEEAETVELTEVQLTATDTTPTVGSTHLITSGGVATALSDKQDVTDNGLNTSAKTVVGAINEVKTKADNADVAVTFADYSSLITSLNSEASTKYKPGQSLYVQTLGIPDLWIMTVASSSVTYTYTTDDAFVTATGVSGGCQVGYYKIGQLESDYSNKMNKNNPVGTGSFSLNRKSGTTVGNHSVALGYNTTASGQNSYAEGSTTSATESCAHAEGYNTTASGQYSHAEGGSTVASGARSHAEGLGTIASKVHQHVSGKYNIQDPGEQTDPTGTHSIYAEIVGNGSADNARSNARALDWDGNAYYKGKVYVNCNVDSTGGNEVATTAYVATEIATAITTALNTPV